MMKTSYYLRIIGLLKKLHISHPGYTLGKILSTALDDYGNIELMTDREIFEALCKYKGELEYAPAKDDDIDEIIKSAMHLESIIENQEEDEDYGED